MKAVNRSPEGSLMARLRSVYPLRMKSSTFSDILYSDSFEGFVPIQILVDRDDPSLPKQKDVPLPHLDFGGTSSSAPPVNQARHHAIPSVQKLERLSAEVLHLLLHVREQLLHSLVTVKGLQSGVFGGAMPFDLWRVPGQVGCSRPSKVLISLSNHFDVLFRHRPRSISRRTASFHANPRFSSTTATTVLRPCGGWRPFAA